MWVDLNPVTADVEPGAETTVTITVRNTGDIVEEYHLQATGDPGQWGSIEPQTLRLYPGTTGTAQLTFTPPRSAEAQAGPQPYAVKVTPRESRENTFAIEGVLRIAEFADLRAELLPSTTRGWHRGKVRLAVDNYSNVVTSAAVSTTSTNSNLQVDIRTAALRLQPGRAQFSKFSVRPGRLLWFGVKAKHQYNVTVTPSGLGQPVSLQGTYLQSALLPRWLQRLLMFFAAAAAAILALWFGIHPSFATSAQASPQPAAATAPTVIVIQPTPAAPSSTPSPKPTTSSAAPPPPPSSSKSVAPPPASTSKAAAPPPSKTPAPPQPPTQRKTTNILNYSANASVDLNMDKFNDGQQVDIWPTNHSNAQTWTVWSYSDGTMVIQSNDKPESAGTKVLQVDEHNSADVDISDDWNGVAGLKAHLTAPFQVWTFTSIPGHANYGVLKNQQSGTCLASKGSAQWLTTVPCNTGDQTQWFWLFAV
ncbi:Ricin B lectin [Catenulispora acidiphila DSM 44928]|uniref:Ricin B lectin n=1 Tax=Catenulispora acidiphila (strain DSM 44928 / JCM 14897 / NBRC 102108 / NRRL B-24433 / ID139908) TaxID=479433 RepID=C7QK07_CATAD|nr:lipase chaperone [Catenulispora acidiphila]ACU73245.1 Ricin B lectin [Catenulispora acidiphila DSM 44928]